MMPNKAPRARGPAANVRSVMYATSPLLASKTPPWRSKFLVALVGASFCVLLGRAVYIQIVGTSFYLRQGEIRHVRQLELPASRGRILDRNGQILAASIPTPSLWAIPKDLNAGSDKLQRRALAKLLGMTPLELEGKLDDNQNFVWLRRQVDEPVAKSALALKLPGVHTVAEYKRVYPEGEAAAQVVGFTDIEDKGVAGIEVALQKELAGRDGSRRVIKDRLGQVVEDVGESVAPVDGRDITLSIDSKVQFFAYQRVRDAVAEHHAKAGSVVVMDVQTGQVLALANYPSFTPTDRRNLTPAQLRNGALSDTFEPGSTMKPLIAGLALETGRVTPDTVIQTAPGRITITGSTITDAHPHGPLTVNEVIQKSSNVGITKIAMQMQAREMWDLYTQVGFGQKPQLAFPGAATGRLRPYKTWRPIEQATMSYGYGLSTSLFQLARAYTMLAHDGELVPTSLVKPEGGAVPAAGETTVPGVRVFSQKTAQQVRHMLQLAAGDGGTAPRAQVMGYSVGGKTGTAHKQEGKVYADKKYRAWFVGMAPINNPRIVVAVMVDEPSNGKYFGGDVAAPVFSQVVQQTLRMMGVQPDIEVKTQVVTHPVTAEEESF
jgi:cell division protein FtsI (penicillin-binding protein 3)